MNGRTHLIAGFLFQMDIIAHYQMSLDLGFITVNPLIGLFGVYHGALMADVDSPKTTMGRRLPALSKMFPTHRGITHAPVVGAGLFGLLFLLSGDNVIINFLASIVFGFVVGYWSHIIIDVFNGKGIPHLFPIIWKRMHVMSVVTESTFDDGKGIKVLKYLESKKWEEKAFAAVMTVVIVADILCHQAGLLV